MALVKTEQKGATLVVIIDVARLLDQVVIDQCHKEINDILDSSQNSNVLLHFGRVAFMSSAALGMLVRLNKKCKEYRVSLKLSDINDDIAQVFKITGLNKVFSIHPHADDAIDAFEKSGSLFSRSRSETRHDLT